MPKLLTHVLFPFFLAIVVCVSVSAGLVQLGDKKLTDNQFKQATMFFQVAKIVNPTNLNIDNHIAATVAMQKEYTESSEESGLPKEIAQAQVKTAAVLGVTTQVPVLMYHCIRVNPWPTDKVGFGLSVTPYDFAQQMDYLETHGYHTITLDQLGANLLYKIKLPQKPIVITFDDGYEDAYTAAYPILKERSMQGVVFVITNFVGLTPYLTWDQISEMQQSGIFTFASHTLNHSSLPALTNSNVLTELTQSKKVLENHLGSPVNWIAYPYGDVNDRVAKLTQQARYLGAFGTKSGTYESIDTLFTEPRIRVGGGENLATFAGSLPWN